MSTEDSIFEEINEELKNEQLFKFFKKYQNTILTLVAIAVIGIIAHSSWYARKNKQMEEISVALLQVLQAPNEKDDVMISGLLENAPSELKPILTIMKHGKKMLKNEELEKNAQALLTLSEKHGIDIIWKDLAVLIYVSYGLKAPSELIKMLQPLTADDRPFRFSALEFIGVLNENMGNHEEALKNFKLITDHREAPNTLKQRIGVLVGHIQNSMEK